MALYVGYVKNMVLNLLLHHSTT